MFFCPDCTYSLDIEKSTNLNYEDNKHSINSVSDAFKLLIKDIDFNDYKAEFSKNDLIKNKKYKQLSNDDKNKLHLLFFSKYSEALLKCFNCGYSKQISESIRLYQFNVNDTDNIIRTLDDNKLLCNDPTLPRTRDYICKNINCITHKKSELKEAVFIRISKKYNLQYICCVCNYAWS